MSAPRVVLVRPRSPGNVGSVARALKNFGMRDLVLVDPRLHRSADRPGEEPFFETESRRMASHAADVLEESRTAATVAEAVADCTVVFATAPQPSGRLRTLTPEEVATTLASQDEGERGALLFGSESSGLTNDELALSAGLLVIPTDTAYRDLNLAQSVAVVAYLCFRAARDRTGLDAVRVLPQPAPHAFVEGTADTLLEVARRSDFLKAGGPPMARELRQILHRMGLSRREAELFRSLWTRVLAKLPEAADGRRPTADGR